MIAERNACPAGGQQARGLNGSTHKIMLKGLLASKGADVGAPAAALHQPVGLLARLVNFLVSTPSTNTAGQWEWM